MNYQRSMIFALDLEQLSDEERALASTALRAFMRACETAAPGTAPKLPSWIVVRRCDARRETWEMRWLAGGLGGRATFDVQGKDVGKCMRWRRLHRGSQSERERQIEAPELVLSAGVKRGTSLLPSAAGLALFTRTPRGETVYLESDRWEHHVVAHHVTSPPQARGKATTTWWPVVHSSTGYSSMSLDQVLDLIVDTVRFGHWQNAPRGTRLAVYQVPEQQAQVLGVSEVKVSTAPDGRILSAYPTAGTNVLAVRERTAQEQGQSAQSGVAGLSAAGGAPVEGQPFRTHVPQTTFG